MSHPIWTLQIYTQDGEAVATAHQHPNAPPIVHGNPAALIEALPSITRLPDFFTDPMALGAAAYTAFRDASGDYALPTWEQLVSDPNRKDHVQSWISSGQAARRVDATLN